MADATDLKSVEDNPHVGSTPTENIFYFILFCIMLGQTPTVEKDAVHVAILKVVADESVMPGCKVGYKEGKISSKLLPHVGVVDPFLAEFVPKGGECYLCLFPNSVTGMVHQWECPAIPQVKPVVTRQEKVLTSEENLDACITLLAELIDAHNYEAKDLILGYNVYTDDESLFRRWQELDRDALRNILSKIYPIDNLGEIYHNDFSCPC